MSDEVRRLEVDAEALKAMAHPLRVQILRQLDVHQRASVTSLAEALGETTGAISYHLRQLAKHGFVEEFDADPEPDGEQRPGRKQQWWRRAVDEIHISGFGFMADERTREAAGFLLRDIQADRSRRLAHWFSTATQWPEEWQRASGDSDGTLQLSARQSRAMVDELHAVIAKYRGLKPGKDARTVDFQYAVFPAEDGTRP